MYYIVEQKYVGPNTEDHLNDHMLMITNAPPQANMSHEVRTKGWLGTTNDWAEFAHGEFKNLSEAREMVAHIAGDAGYRTPNEEEFFIHLDDTIVEEYRVGAVPFLNSKETEDVVYSEAIHEITTSTTDQEIEQLAKRYVDDIQENMKVKPDKETIMELFYNIRQEQLQELEEEQEGPQL